MEVGAIMRNDGWQEITDRRAHEPGTLAHKIAGARSTESSGFAKEGKPWVLDEKGIFES